LRVLSAAGLGSHNIPVVAGQNKPLMRPPLHCPQIHGESGLDGPFGGPVLPASNPTATPGKAVLIMFDTIQKNFNNSTTSSDKHTKVQLVATGALTNVAVLLILFPEVVDMIEIVLMGGALGIGNTGPVVEFNIQTDPEAARVVFESGAQVTMVPLEVTHTALATPEVLKRINDIEPGHPFLGLIAALLLFFAETYKRVFRFEHPPLHDPCAVAYVIAPELFEVEKLRVDIETQSELSAGQTVVDLWGSSGKKPNANVCMKLKVDKFWNLMVDAIEAATNASTLETKVPVAKGPVQVARPLSGGGGSSSGAGSEVAKEDKDEVFGMSFSTGGFIEGCGDEEDALKDINGVV
jgi:inosine-uridine nucleoside N-ribohydrolase